MALIIPSAALLLGTGYYLRSRTPYGLGGNLLFLVGTGLVPIALFAIGSAFSSNPSDQFFSEDDLPGATLLFAVSAALTLILVMLTRIPQASLVPAGLCVAMAATAAAWESDSGSDEIWTGVLAAGATIVGASVLLSFLKLPDYSLWTGIIGHAASLAGASALLCFIHWTTLSGAAFLLLYICVLLLSIPLQSRLFLIAGVIGVYVFVIRITVESVEGPMVPLAFAAIGISLVGLAMGYQRVRQQSAMNLP